MLFIGMLSVQGQGQMNRSPEERAAETSKAMSEAIPNLTESQTEYMQELNLKYTQKQMALFQGASADSDRAAIREQMGEVRKEMNDDFKIFLTEDQYQKYTEFQEMRLERRRQNNGRSPNR